jgi:hypothetical protein
VLIVGRRLVEAARAVRVAEASLSLAEGEILTALKLYNSFQGLGHVRFSDFARECLKIHPRTARRRVALHEFLREVPSLKNLFLSGQLGVSQILALKGVVNAENAAIWANAAERLSVRELRSLVKRAKERAEQRKLEGEDPSRVEGQVENVIRSPDGDLSGMENIVRSPDGDLSGEGPELSQDDDLDDPERRRISFLSPQSAGFAIEHGLETAKRVLGWEAPRDECLAAVLSEAESSLQLPPPLPENGDEPASNHPEISSEDPESETKDQLPETASAIDPDKQHVWFHHKDLKKAKRFLTTVDRKLAKIERLAPAKPDQYLFQDPATLVDRFLAVQRQKNPLRVLQARLYYFICALSVAPVLGFRSDSEAGARLFRITERSARNLWVAGFEFERHPPLADAFVRGSIGMGHVIALGSPAVPPSREWIRRAGSVSFRQFQREVRLIHNLDRYCPNLIGLGPKALPDASLETRLRHQLFGLGWSMESLDKELGIRGLLSPPSASNDPAENPAAMRRLEVLTDMVVLEQCAMEELRRADEQGASRDPSQDEARQSRKTLSAVGGRAPNLSSRHVRITVWAKGPTWDHWHRSRLHVHERCGALPDWAVATLLFQAALIEWERIDPDRVPTERKILERDGYLCQAPGCSSRKNLEVHHVIFRSVGGPDKEWNLVTLCHAHHQHAVHRHTLRVTGDAPYALTWEFGRSKDNPPRWVYRGEKLCA